LTILTNTATL
jgi:hypothetical protein